MQFKTLTMAAAIAAMSFGVAQAQTTSGAGDTAGAPNSTPSMATPSTAADAKADSAMTATSSDTPMATDTTKVSHMTKSFIENASAGGMFEIETSKLALTRSTNQKVKDFAQKMIDDHTKANDDMKAAIASSPKEQSYVSTKLPMMKEHKLHKLEKADAKDFDKEYVDIQADAHKETIDLFAKYAQKGDNAALKTFATNTMPTLQNHMEMVDGIKASMK